MDHEEIMRGLSAVQDLHNAAVNVMAYLDTLIANGDLPKEMRYEMEVAKALIDTQDDLLRGFIEKNLQERDALAKLVKDYNIEPPKT